MKHVVDRTSTAARDRFAQSALVASLWPQPIRDASLPYFAVQDAINVYMFGDRPGMAALHQALTRSPVTTPAVAARQQLGCAAPRDRGVTRGAGTSVGAVPAGSSLDRRAQPRRGGPGPSAARRHAPHNETMPSAFGSMPCAWPVHSRTHSAWSASARRRGVGRPPHVPMPFTRRSGTGCETPSASSRAERDPHPGLPG